MTLAIVTIETLAGKLQINKITAKAINVTIATDTCNQPFNVWLPLSQLRVIETVNGTFLVIPQWLAKENGLSSRSYVCTESELQSSVHNYTAKFIPIV